jgi:crossover junction endodeoxyribonuclease RusA
MSILRFSRYSGVGIGVRRGLLEGAGTMAVSLKLTAPLPPSVNHQYATVGNRRVLSKEAQAFKRNVKKLIERARMDFAISIETETTLQTSLLGVYLTFYFETPFKRDLDGGLKICLDAVCGSLGVDDRSIVDLHLTKQIDPLNPRVDIEIEAIEEWTFDQAYVSLGEPGAADG